jgi:hypothetical protein
MFFLVAIVITIFSSNIQRVGPEMGVWGNVCGESGNELCYEPVLNGGFPFPYLIDNLGVSVPGALHYAEDEFRLIPFMLDVILMSVFLSAIFIISKELLRKRIAR